MEDDKIELPSSDGVKKEVYNPLSLTEPAGKYIDYKCKTLGLIIKEIIDLVKYGLIPEFVGRLPVISSVNNLSTDDLVRVLTEPKNSLLKQYQGLFELSQVYTQQLDLMNANIYFSFKKVELRFSKTALRKIAELALEKKTGARGLRRIMVK